MRRLGSHYEETRITLSGHYDHTTRRLGSHYQDTLLTL